MLRDCLIFSRTLMLVIALAGCGLASHTERDYPNDAQANSGSGSELETTLRLPVAVANNAVALAMHCGRPMAVSVNGLTAQKDWRATSNLIQVVALSELPADCDSSGPDQLLTLPGPGRLASVAATVNNQVYVFGGYTVAEDHSEVSLPDASRIDLAKGEISPIAAMPVPVDDSVALVYQNRYIYLVSGWHNDGNVRNVQVYDTLTDRWAQASEFPGAPVFGHAAGIVGNKIMVIDGVRVAGVVDGRRDYQLTAQVFIGEIDPDRPTQIIWQQLENHPGPARYRAAMIGDESRQRMVIAGGSDNPYNFNGVGYNGVPSEPLGEVLTFALDKEQWRTEKLLEQPTMDHRGLLQIGAKFYIVGGMSRGQVVSDSIWHFKLDGDN